MATRRANGSYTAKDIQVLEGLEAVRRRPAMYIGSTGAPRPASPHLGGGRQLRRRGHGRLLQDHRSHPAGRRRRPGQRRRPRHPRGHPRQGEAVGTHRRPHQTARRGQVRFGRLHGVRRPPRGGRVGGQRPVPPARGRGGRRRVPLVAGLPNGRPGGQGRQGQGGAAHRDHHHLLADRPPSSPRPRSSTTPPSRPGCARWPSSTRASRSSWSTNGAKGRARSSATAAASSTSCATSTPSANRSTPTSSASRSPATTSRWTWRCSGTPATPRPSSPSPTTSTPTRAGPTKRASGRP